MTSSEEPTVLVVEDETFVRMIAADALAESGFQVLEAPDATEALALLEKHEVAVVLNRAGFAGGSNS
ncbi:response regulator [Sphingomonas sp. ABOLD]|uniref:CheY-like chemotaxis protein n=1 Tax=Sphingomonas trueperi TaxID=53317 RepID=A0A7X6BDH7_9SPHN|nr:MULTISPECIES: response regulator [Sphingomonas]NJB97727.1 CheY-like chemotaxis protein [Sphingomonas trueperi]RSV52925.1 response regulator [Sphingomonas sp. ABOLD]